MKHIKNYYKYWLIRSPDKMMYQDPKVLMKKIADRLDEYTLCYCPSDKDLCYECKKNYCIYFREDNEKNPSITKRYICRKCLMEELRL